MKFFKTLTVLASISFSYGSTDVLLNQDGKEINLSSKIVVGEQIELSDPFLIQLYTVWKSQIPRNSVTEKWIQHIYSKNYQKALKEMALDTNLLHRSLVKASEIYVLHQMNLHQTVAHQILSLKEPSVFFKTNLGLALDQVLVKNPHLYYEKGLSLSDEDKEYLSKIESLEAKIIHQFQAFAALKKGDNALISIGRLGAAHPLRIPLAKTSLLHYARNGKLGASGKLLKSVLEPFLEKNLESLDNEEEISVYFLTLARLLYQANALDESITYYDLIPQTSKYFLTARSEVLWAHLRKRDYAKTKGELATLELDVLNDKFYPEAYVISAMASTMLCQFVNAKEALNRFIKVNVKWVDRISHNLQSDNPELIISSFFTRNNQRSINTLESELKTITSSGETLTSYKSSLESRLSHAKMSLIKEKRNQWKLREKLLESALYKMKFVRIELLSRMRAVKEKEDQKISANTDSVSNLSAANVRTNQMAFPQDGIIWGDDLFNMTASVEDKCEILKKKRLK